MTGPVSGDCLGLVVQEDSSRQGHGSLSGQFAVSLSKVRHNFTVRQFPLSVARVAECRHCRRFTLFPPYFRPSLFVGSDEDVAGQALMLLVVLGAGGGLAAGWQQCRNVH